MANVHPLQLSKPLDSSQDPLGLSEDHSQTHNELPYNPSRVKRMSAVVGQTVDKLSRSLSTKTGRTSPSPATTPPPTSGHRRLFSLSRKGKGKDAIGDNDSKHPTTPNLVTLLVISYRFDRFVNVELDT